MMNQTQLEVEINRLNTALESAKIGIWDWNVIEDKLIWDARMYRLYGTQPENFSGAYSAWQAGLYEDDKKRGDDEIQSALKGEKSFDITFRVVWPNQSIHWIKGHAKIQRNKAGKPEHMIGVNWDVTEAMEAEAALTQKIREVEHLNELMIGRELKMVELKEQIAMLNEGGKQNT